MSYYGQYTRHNLQTKLNIERRKRYARRLYYHAMEYIGAFFWMTLTLMVCACFWAIWVIERTK